ncbi:hypothetical protein [Roseateles albus]|uniref:Uncharacterized protein n=1 Tax=Roseateles albus TaxID=2987525 RepID=A0ABT5KCX5_9BURK|nr:hypothetical protein [Roseateles albus]MDC8771778.1 hypothetical protein [Roseateles albus]
MNDVVSIEQEATLLGGLYAAAGFRPVAKAPPEFIRAFRKFKGAPRTADYFETKWLGLRLNALKRGFVVDITVTPETLKTITGERCPVSLQGFVFKGTDPCNPSVDRLYNEGTYALSNLCVLTQRVNRAKGSKSFLEAASIASTGEPFEGLLPIEWARLATLMYGAWDAYNGQRDKYLMPLATYPTRHIFTSTSQLVQVLLLLACLKSDWLSHSAMWLYATRTSGQVEGLLLSFLTRLRSVASEEDYAPNAWLDAEVFNGFETWYKACEPAIKSVLESRRSMFQDAVDVDAMLESWAVDAS